MNFYAVLEPLILGAVLLGCCAACLRKFAPGLWRRLLGKAPAQAAKAGCGSGCSTCGSCGTDHATPIRIHPR